MSDPIALHEPRFEGNEWAYVKECLDTGWVSSGGAFVTRFEDALARVTGTTGAVAVVNGTSALHLALEVVGVGQGDLVIVPSLSFIATANAVSYCGASPVFVDAERPSLGMSPDSVARFLAEACGPGPVHRATGRRVAACVPMHTFGHPVRMAALLDVCDRAGIPVVEDAAEALGSRLGDRPCGSLGRVGILSFNGNKIVTTGGGGALVTDDEALAARARHLSTQAKRPHRWCTDHDEAGYNYRLPNINAALGLAQLERLDALVAAKRAIAGHYRSAFAGTAVELLDEPAGSSSNFWLVCIAVAPSRRDLVLAALHDARILARPAWELLSRAGLHPGAVLWEDAAAAHLHGTLVSLPSSPHLGAEEIALVARVVLAAA